MMSWTRNNSELLNGILEPYFWKPANNNQKQNGYNQILGKWKNAASNRIVENAEAKKQEGLVIINFHMNLPDIGADYTLKYSVNSIGQIQVDVGLLRIIPTEKQLRSLVCMSSN